MASFRLLSRVQLGGRWDGACFGALGFLSCFVCFSVQLASCSVVRAQVGVSGRMSGHGWPRIDGAVGWVPVWWRWAEKVSRGDGHRCRMATHEVHFGLVAVVGLDIRHLILVLNNPTISWVVLVCLRDALEVKFVGVALAVHLSHDVLVVVVAQGAAQLVVVHVWLALALTPAFGHFVRVGHLELTVGTLPGNDAGIVAVRQKLQKELPQLDLPWAWEDKRRRVKAQSSDLTVTACSKQERKLFVPIFIYFQGIQSSVFKNVNRSALKLAFKFV